MPKKIEHCGDCPHKTTTERTDIYPPFEQYYCEHPLRRQPHCIGFLEHESNEDDDLSAKTAKNEIVLVCDDLDYAAIQNAIARRQSSRIMPDNGSNVAGAVIAEICRGWEEMLDCDKGG